MAFIYKITNTINGKAYIGATITKVNERWNRHVHASFKFLDGQALHAAIRKYGKEAFKIEILHEDPDADYVFNVLEPKYIVEHNTYGNNGYNMTRGGDGWLNMKHKPESIEKMRQAKLGKKLSEETKRKIGENSYFRGKEPWNKGKKCPELANWKDKIMSEETKKKISDYQKGKKQPDSQKEAVKEANSEKHKILHVSTGKIFEVFNASQFCKENGISYGNLKNYGHTKGYKMLETTKKIRTYTIEHIESKEIFVTKNLKAFCEERGLSNSSLYSGNYHKGYRLISKEMIEETYTYP